MGKREVYNFLEKHKGMWFTVKQIEKQLGLSTVGLSLRKLRRLSEVKYKKVLNKGKTYLYSSCS